jgi:hypothetical protein
MFILSESNLCGTHDTNPRQYPSSDYQVKWGGETSVLSETIGRVPVNSIEFHQHDYDVVLTSVCS